MTPRVLMFGWELPPFNSGGLGTACFGLSSNLVDQGAKIIFVLPHRQPVGVPGVDVIFGRNDRFDPSLAKLFNPYITSGLYQKLRDQAKADNYGFSLLEEVYLYASDARKIARENDFDVIHAHDWLCYPAGLAAKEETGKPLVIHVHATEYDRTGGTGFNPDVYRIEKMGMEMADKIITVSDWTKKIVVDHYGIDPDKIVVVHNGVEDHWYRPAPAALDALKSRGAKIVLFVGRLTIQKGPDYFLRSARLVADYLPDTYFVIAGSGDMEWQLVREVAALGLAQRVFFAGFARGDELAALYRAADCLVMPSVSEPFGIVPLEALAAGTPVIVSKQSGVAEVLDHALKVDFWDVEELANKIISLLKHKPLKKALALYGREDAKRITWSRAAQKCLDVYKKVITVKQMLS